MSYNNSVFINCPFDDDFFPLLKAILFTCIYCKLHPRLSETRDSDDIRIKEIQDLIAQCRYSIHDLSRMESIAEGELPRFNMPFELGLDIGCKTFSVLNKKCLILEKEANRYKIVLSDISGQDIKHHNNDPRQVVQKLRNWFYLIFPRRKIEKYTVIWDYFNEFLFDFESEMKADHMNPDNVGEIPFSELIAIMKAWIKRK